MSKFEEISATVGIKEYIKEYRDVEKFLGFCHECNAFGKTWACPPFQEEIDLNVYNYAHLFGRKILIEPQRREKELTPEELKKAMEELLRPQRELLDDKILRLESLNEGSTALFAGSCRGCELGSCSRLQGEPCVKPHRMRPSLESIGFDVAKSSSQLLGIELQWSSNHLPEYFTLIYALFSAEQRIKFQ